MIPVTYRPTPRERFLATVPALTVAAAVLLMSLPLPLVWGVLPNIAVLMLFCWAAVQPGLVPPWVAFLLGLLMDLVTGTPLGVNVLQFIAVVLAVRLTETRVEAHSLLLDWLAAALLIVGLSLLEWQLLSFVGRPVPLPPLIAQALTTILSYPLAVRLVGRLQRRLAKG